MKSFIHQIQAIRTKLRFIDVLIIFVSLVVVAFIAYLFFRKGTYLVVTIKVGQDNILYQPLLKSLGTQDWLDQQFHVGMKELDGFGKTSAEVISVYSYDSSPLTGNVYLTLKLKTTYIPGSNQYTYRGKSVLIGSTIRVYLDKVLVDGMITNIEGASDIQQRHKMLITAQLLPETYNNMSFQETDGVRPYLADALSVGDTAKDNQGNPVIIIRDKQVKDASRFVVTSDGGTIVETNPLLKNVSYTIEVYAVKYLNRYFIFDDVPVLIGQQLPIHTTTTSLYPEITNILSIN